MPLSVASGFALADHVLAAEQGLDDLGAGRRGAEAEIPHRVGELLLFEGARQQVSGGARVPHDPDAFTQGLVYLDGFLYEGTGLNGRSSIRKVRLENGEVVQIQKVDPQYFGEGIAVKGDTIYELTWQSEIGFLYDRATFKRKGTFNYKGEGWGLTHDGQRLIMSDGTAFLRFLDPVSLKELSPHSGQRRHNAGW